MPPKSDERRQRIVEAATTLFARHGFKRTSVELLASEAGVAKPTVYAYFEDKDAVFRAVAETVCEGFLDGAESASRARGPLEERVAAMLAAKLTRYWELVQASPHAEELIASQDRLVKQAVARYDRAFLELLVSVLNDAERSKTVDSGRLGLTPRRLAELLLRAASGAAYDAVSAAAHRRHLGEIVRAILAGVAAAPAAARRTHTQRASRQSTSR